MTTYLFTNRQEAGKKLAQALQKYKDKPSVVYALPRGGVIPGLEVARFLHAPLDLLITRKIGHPDDPEFALAAVSENGQIVGDEEEMKEVDTDWLLERIAEEKEEIQRRRKAYLKGKSAISSEKKFAIIVDDGMATGISMRAAVKQVHHFSPTKIIVAVPVAPEEIIKGIEEIVDEVICLKREKKGSFLGAIGSYYQSFPQLSDEEVKEAMKRVKIT